MNVKSNRRGKWNVVDVLILLFVAIMIMTLGYMMFFADSNLLERFNAKGETVTVSYTFQVELEQEDNDLLVDIKPGDVFYHLDDGFSLGEVVDVRENFVLEVEAQAIVGEKGIYYVNDHVVNRKEKFEFSTPYFTGVCKCIAVERVIDGE